MYCLGLGYPQDSLFIQINTKFQNYRENNKNPNPEISPCVYYLEF
jgi:hypothetical protein